MKRAAKQTDVLYAGQSPETVRLMKQAKKELRLKARKEWKEKQQAGQ